MKQHYYDRLEALLDEAERVFEAYKNGAESERVAYLAKLEELHSRSRRLYNLAMVDAGHTPEKTTLIQRIKDFLRG